ncbi:hypothetical protein L6164_019028 [Bauhinia variegata]|uniref:Uncharacterized protein n=1 Tax=Bauhinia variegata TaxID=167791 RepID=A0ACB9NCW9_BAUVA|nr:hypothetical protein L6164_019028 [Bauhinia variegata]
MAQPNPPRRIFAQRQRRSPLLWYIAVIILGLVVLVGIAVLIIWLVVKPKHLEYSVENASIHNFNLTDANHLYANFDFSIRAYNPNSKVSIYYDSVEVSVQYEDQTLATNAVAPFFQSHKNVTRLQPSLTAQTVALYGSVPADLRRDKSSGNIELDVWVRARIRFKVGRWKSEHRILRIFCSPVLVHFSSSKGFDRTKCDVEL